MVVDLYTDGACSGNPGPGGWGWVAKDGRSGSGGETNTTNQRMEVRAVLEGLRAVDGPVNVISDSTYVVKCFNDRWFEGWLQRGWKNAQKKPVANRDLWEPLISLYLKREEELTFTWVKGHSGDEFNDIADQLAVAARDEQISLLAGAAAQGLGEAVAVPWPKEHSIWLTGQGALDRETRPRLDGEIAKLASGDLLVSGLRRGVELEGAEIALRRGVELAVVLPFSNPAADWPSEHKGRFEVARRRASWVVTLAGDEAKPGQAVQERDRWMSEAVVGAIIVGNPDLSAELTQAGLSVIAIDPAPIPDS